MSDQKYVNLSQELIESFDKCGDIDVATSITEKFWKDNGEYGGVNEANFIYACNTFSDHARKVLMQYPQQPNVHFRLLVKT